MIFKKREVILVLLFFNDFYGIIDIFNEFMRNFGWDLFVIIVEEYWLFCDFVDIIEREGKGSKENLEKVLVIGMFWNYVSSIVIFLLGYDEKIGCVLLCLFGVFMNVEEKFINILIDLKILSVM